MNGVEFLTAQGAYGLRDLVFFFNHQSGWFPRENSRMARFSRYSAVKAVQDLAGGFIALGYGYGRPGPNDLDGVRRHAVETAAPRGAVKVSEKLAVLSTSLQRSAGLAKPAAPA